ncbi:MAG: InlB B-repeat-containing protein [Lachnospiraceae bacterium]|nr:InlB B-repeat-containing protein [Lachnospiraceae bacterium]
MVKSNKVSGALIRVLAVISVMVTVILMSGRYDAFAADEYYKIDGLYWGFEKSTGTITWVPWDWQGGEIPSEIEGVKVAAIGEWACCNNDKGQRDHVTEIIVPEGVTKLESGVFWKCRIKSIHLPESLTVIADQVFGRCTELEEMAIPGNVREIGDYAFMYDEKLERVTVGGDEIDYLFQFEEKGIKLGEYAFRGVYFLRKDFSPSYKTGKYYTALHELTLDAGTTGDYVSDIFKIANSQKGYHEGDSFDEQHGNNKRGDNDFTEYNYWYGEPGTKWCGEFAAWVIAMASVPTEIYSTKYHTPEEDTYKWQDTAYAGGSYKLKKGDVILFLYDGGNHVVTVESVSVDGNKVRIDTIDGNDSDSVTNDVYEIDAKTGKTTNCWTDINGHVDEIYGPDWSKVENVKYYTVKFDANGGSVKTKSKKLSNGAFYGVLPIPSRSGYEFDGWYTEKEGGKKITAYRIVSLTGNTTLYAHWNAAQGDENKGDTGNNEKTEKLTLKASVSKSKIKYSAVKKKTRSVTIKVETNAGKVEFSNVSSASLKSFITISEDGKVTIAKGAKKGTYKIKVTATSEDGSQTAVKTVKIKVK